MMIIIISGALILLTVADVLADSGTEHPGRLMAQDSGMIMMMIIISGALILLTVADVLADFRYRTPWAFIGPRSQHING